MPSLFLAAANVLDITVEDSRPARPRDDTPRRLGQRPDQPTRHPPDCYRTDPFWGGATARSIGAIAVSRPLPVQGRHGDRRLKGVALRDSLTSSLGYGASGCA